MPQIIPIKDLKDTAAISEMCSNSNEPIFVTKNGYGEMVIMSISLYEQYMRKLEVYSKIEEAEQDLKNNDYYNADMAVAELREKHREKHNA